MARDDRPTPAIVRDFQQEDADVEVLRTMQDTVTSRRGFGDTGHRFQIVGHECPRCRYDRMVRKVHVSPEQRNRVRYWCMNPSCSHHVEDCLSHTGGRRARYPEVTPEV